MSKLDELDFSDLGNNHETADSLTDFYNKMVEFGIKKDFDLFPVLIAWQKSGQNIADFLSQDESLDQNMKNVVLKIFEKIEANLPKGFKLKDLIFKYQKEVQGNIYDNFKNCPDLELSFNDPRLNELTGVLKKLAKVDGEIDLFEEIKKYKEFKDTVISQNIPEYSDVSDFIYRIRKEKGKGGEAKEKLFSILEKIAKKLDTNLFDYLVDRNERDQELTGLAQEIERKQRLAERYLLLSDSLDRILAGKDYEAKVKKYNDNKEEIDDLINIELAELELTGANSTDTKKIKELLNTVKETDAEEMIISTDVKEFIEFLRSRAIYYAGQVEEMGNENEIKGNAYNEHYY